MASKLVRIQSSYSIQGVSYGPGFEEQLQPYLDQGWEVDTIHMTSTSVPGTQVNEFRMVEFVIVDLYRHDELDKVRSHPKVRQAEEEALADVREETTAEESLRRGMMVQDTDEASLFEGLSEQGSEDE